MKSLSRHVASQPNALLQGTLAWTISRGFNCSGKQGQMNPVFHVSHIETQQDVLVMRRPLDGLLLVSKSANCRGRTVCSLRKHSELSTMVSRYARMCGWQKRFDPVGLKTRGCDRPMVSATPRSRVVIFKFCMEACLSQLLVCSSKVRTCLAHLGKQRLSVSVEIRTPASRSRLMQLSRTLQLHQCCIRLRSSRFCLT